MGGKRQGGVQRNVDLNKNQEEIKEKTNEWTKKEGKEGDKRVVGN